MARALETIEGQPLPQEETPGGTAQTTGTLSVERKPMANRYSFSIGGKTFISVREGENADTEARADLQRKAIAAGFDVDLTGALFQGGEAGAQAVLGALTMGTEKVSSGVVAPKTDFSATAIPRTQAEREELARENRARISGTQPRVEQRGIPTTQAQTTGTVTAPVGSKERTQQLLEASQRFLPDGAPQVAGTPGLPTFQYVDNQGKVRTFQATDSDEALKNLPEDAAPTSGVRKISSPADPAPTGFQATGGTEADVIASYGVDVDKYRTGRTSPADYVDDFKAIYDSFGLGTVRAQSEAINKELEDLRNKKDDEARDINDNPWFTEGVRVAKLRKLDEKYEDREGNLIGRLQISQSTYDQGVAEARFVMQSAYNQFNADRSFDQNMLFQFLDQAQSQADAESDLFFREAGLGIDLAKLDIAQFTAETGRISALRPRAGAGVAKKSPLFTAAEEELFTRFGVSLDVADNIYELLIAGASLEEIREWLRANGLDIGILDTFDTITGGKNIGALDQPTTGVPSGEGLF